MPPRCHVCQTKSDRDQTYHDRRLPSEATPLCRRRTAAESFPCRKNGTDETESSVRLIDSLGAAVRVSIWTISPGLAGLSPVGPRRARFRWLRAALGAFLRSAGTGSTDPWRTRCARTRPMVLLLAACPSHRTATAILAFPHIGWSRRASWTASASSATAAGAFGTGVRGGPAVEAGPGLRAWTSGRRPPRRPFPPRTLVPRQIPSIQNAAPESSGIARGPQRAACERNSGAGSESPQTPFYPGTTGEGVKCVQRGKCLTPNRPRRSNCLVAECQAIAPR